MNDTNEFKLGKGGLIPPPEHYEKQFTAAAAGAIVPYPEECIIDIVEKMRVEMQGQIGSCVANTGEEVVRLHIYLLTGIQPDQLSWRWVYAIAKALDGAGGEGTYPSVVSSILRTHGVPLAKFCPNDVKLAHETFVYNRTLKDKAALVKQFGQEAYDDAQTRKAGFDATFPCTADGVKRAVYYAKQNNGAVMILRSVGDTYWVAPDGTSTWAREKLGPNIKAPKEVTSGHEELLYGYLKADATGKTPIKWLNHWSEKWFSTGGVSNDGGRGQEYLEDWLPFIKEVRVVLPAVPVEPNINFTYSFTKFMSYGDKNNEVLALQHALKVDGEFPASQPLTGYFGTITLKAVKDFQQKYASDILTPNGLTKPTGLVRGSTIAKLNSLFSK